MSEEAKNIIMLLDSIKKIKIEDEKEISLEIGAFLYKELPIIPGYIVNKNFPFRTKKKFICSGDLTIWENGKMKCYYHSASVGNIRRALEDTIAQINYTNEKVEKLKELRDLIRERT